MCARWDAAAAAVVFLIPWALSRPNFANYWRRQGSEGLSQYSFRPTPDHNYVFLLLTFSIFFPSTCTCPFIALRSSIATGAILSLLWCWANVCVGIHRLESRNTLQTDWPPRGEWSTSTSVITRELYYVLCRPSRRLGCGNSSRTSRLQWRRRREPTLWWSSAPDTGQYT